MLVAPELSGAAAAGLHLVEHEQRAVALGALAQPGEVALRHGHVAAVAEERLDEDRRQLVRGDAGGEQEVEFFEGIVDRLVLRHTQAEGMGE